MERITSWLPQLCLPLYSSSSSCQPAQSVCQQQRLSLPTFISTELLHNRKGILRSTLEREADNSRDIWAESSHGTSLCGLSIAHYGDGTCMWYTQSSVSPVIMLTHKLASAGWLSCGITPQSVHSLRWMDPMFKQVLKQHKA